MMWHAMTVQHAKVETNRLIFKTLFNNHIPLQLNPDDRVGGHRVLLAMVGFVDHFFGCRECARHFLQSAGGAEGRTVVAEVDSPRDEVLWLWKTHNKVNLVRRGDFVFLDE